MTKLKIQQGDSVENTSSAVIDKLYRLALSIEGNNILLTGNIQSSAAYEDAVKYLAGKIGTALNSQGRFEGLTITVLNDNYYIRFADPQVEPTLIANGYSLDGIGISKNDALRATKINDSLFRGNTDLYTFDELDEFGNITIYGHAFHDCSNMLSIDLSNVTGIGDLAFNGCYSLNGDISIPNLTLLTGERLFRSCRSITSVSNLGQITKITPYMFLNDELLQSIVLPNTVTEIGSYAFDNCTNLSSINIADSVIKVGLCSMRGTAVAISVSDIQNIQQFVGSRDGGWRCHRNGGLGGSPKITGTLYLPNATNIGGYTFSYEGVTTVDIPNLITISSNNTFASNTALTSVTLGGTFTEFSEDYGHTTSIGMFDGCTNLNSVTVTAPITHIPTAMFSNCSPSTINIDFDKITKIGKNAFCFYNAPNKVLAFKNVTELCYGYTVIGNNRIYNGNALSDSLSNISIYLPKITATNTLALRYQNYSIPAKSVFYNVKNLGNWWTRSTVYNTIYFRDILQIDAGAFWKCNIKSLIINNVQPPSIIPTDHSKTLELLPSINTDMFAGVSSIDNIYVPDNAVSTYQNDSRYSSMADKIKGISQCPIVTLAQQEQGAVGVISDYM